MGIPEEAATFNRHFRNPHFVLPGENLPAEPNAWVIVADIVVFGRRWCPTLDKMFWRDLVLIILGVVLGGGTE